VVVCIALDLLFCFLFQNIERQNNLDFVCIESKTDSYCRAYLNVVLDERLIDLLCLTPLSAIFQLYHGDQF
jgi:hypothetical protein